MRVLSIETSCDETAVTLIEGALRGEDIHFSILGNSLFSQAQLHAEYGGVYPTLAKREHEKNLPIMLREALTQAGGDDSVDAVVVTRGPGLEPALWTGITFAERIAKAWDKPLLPVNHLEGHLISSLVEDNVLRKVELPLVALLISGGHTEFVRMEPWLRYKVLGETLDDAVGEAFDKVARMLDLPYPGGPHISHYAELAREQGLQLEGKKLPRPMLATHDCQMSFSGLKTAALYWIRDRGGIESIPMEERYAFAREFEDAVTEVFVSKTRRALLAESAATFVIGGGVAANAHIRASLQAMVASEFPDIEMRLPELAITGDNAVMIGQAALAHLLIDDWELEPVPSFSADGNLSIASEK